jgi:hypothetical protein
MRPFRIVFLKPEFGAPLAQVAISDFTKHDYKGEENTIFISQQCATLGELECAIAQLHAELDRLMVEARQKFGVS